MKEKEKECGRRSFLKHLVAGTAVAAGVAGTGRNVLAKSNQSPVTEGSETLYRETENFRQYYQSLRS